MSTSLTIESMDRHKGGLYICTASNGVGLAAITQVNVHVLCKLLIKLIDSNFMKKLILKG